MLFELDMETPGIVIDPLLDGASTLHESISSESLELSQYVRNAQHALIDRLDAYTDIINIEIGDTSLIRARNFEREFDLKQIWLKFEGNNPSGTQKDRIAFAQCLDALRREYDTITLATCGNYGAAISLAANLAGLRCLVCIPETYHTERVREMEAQGAHIIRTPGKYEDAVWYSRKLAETEGYYDANPGGSNSAIQIIAYAEIANEIYDVLRDAPKIVAVPVSNGTLLAGIYRGFASLYKRGKTSRIPRFVAASSYKKNPIIYSFKKGLEKCVNIEEDKIKESRINEPLINWHSFDGNEALWALNQTQGEAFDISDHKMMQYSRQLKQKEGLHVLPASTVGLAALLEMHKADRLEGDRYVVILTGRH